MANDLAATRRGVGGYAMGVRIFALPTSHPDCLHRRCGVSCSSSERCPSALLFRAFTTKTLHQALLKKHLLAALFRMRFVFSLAECDNPEHKESRKTGKEKVLPPGFLHSLCSFLLRVTECGVPAPRTMTQPLIRNGPFHFRISHTSATWQPRPLPPRPGS